MTLPLARALRRPCLPVAAFLCVAVLAAHCPHALAAAKTKDPLYEARALWVTRWDFRSPEDIRAIMANAAAHYFNIVLFQVRGEATVFYRSQIEPWAWELTGSSPAATGTDPQWDPLQIAIDEAHRHGLELHAYLNVMPAWQQKQEPPAHSGHVWAVHRDWALHTRDGKPMPVPKSIYACLNPAHPEVKLHLTSLFQELALNYAVDGIHLDYIRYPGEYRNGDLGYDPYSLALFKEQYNTTPDAAPKAWNQFRRDHLTDIVRRIHDAVKEINPSIMLSAAVIANRTDALQCHHQDSMLWLQQGYVDCLMPMNYTSKMELFRKRNKVFVDTHQRGLIYMGLWAKYSDDALRNQIDVIRQSGFHGVGVFAYTTLFPAHKPTDRARMLKEEIFRHPARVTGRKYEESP